MVCCIFRFDFDICITIDNMVHSQGGSTLRLPHWNLLFNYFQLKQAICNKYTATNIYWSNARRLLFADIVLMLCNQLQSLPNGTAIYQCWPNIHVFSLQSRNARSYQQCLIGEMFICSRAHYTKPQTPEVILYRFND